MRTARARCSGRAPFNFVSDGPVHVLSGGFVVAPAPPGVRLLIGVAPFAEMNLGQSFGVPITADLSNRGAANLAVLDVTTSWDTARFVYVDRSVGPWLDSRGPRAVGATIPRCSNRSLSGSGRGTERGKFGDGQVRPWEFRNATRGALGWSAKCGRIPHRSIA